MEFASEYVYAEVNGETEDIYEGKQIEGFLDL
jgi:hypothetical protein